MKTNYNVIFTLLLAFTVHFSFAQKTVSGTVSDETGPLPGVSVLIKGTTTGAETDFDGNYAIQAKQGDILQYSFVGMETAFKTVGNSNNIDVVMTVSSENVLEEVIINALGIETRQVSRTASVSKVGGDKISESGEASMVQGLAGKASGVAVVNSSGDPGSSAYVQIRGQTSITRDLQPLYVVDGVPINNDEINARVDGVAQQSRLNDINPNDIASVKVLKGASAAALWGSRAANGVILITTKTGRSAKEGTFNISLSTKFSFDTPLTRQSLQNKYGKGGGGNWNDSDDGGSWGDLISDRIGGPDLVNETGGQYFVAEDGTVYRKVLLSSQTPDGLPGKRSRETFNDKNYDAIFDTGLFVDTGVTITSRTENGNFFASFSKLDQDGTIGGGDGTNYYERYTARFNANQRINDKLSLKGSVSYSNVNANRVQQGSNLSGLLLGLYRTPADFDNTHYIGTHYEANGIPNFNSHRAYRVQYGTQDRSTPYYNNPLWTVYKQKNPNKVNRVTGGFESNFDVTDWLQLIGKAAIDSYTDDRYSLFPVNSGDPDPAPDAPPGVNTGNGNGWHDEDFITYNQYQIDFIAQINKNISEDIRSYFTVGFNALQRSREWRGGEYRAFILDSDHIDPNNSEYQKTWTDTSKERNTAMYGVADFSYNNMLLLHLTGRAEQSSTFGVADIYFFPSAEFGFQFSEISGLNKIGLNNGKLRVGWGQVGQQPSPYNTNTYYSSAFGFDSYIDGSVYDAGAYVPSATLQTELSPEIMTEFEVGLDLAFWNNRFSLSANYYDNNVDDVLLFVGQPASTGYTGAYANAAKMENTGYELELSVDVLKSDNFTWNLGGNWSQNENLVRDMFFTENQFLDGFAGTASIAKEGYPLGILWGAVFDRDAQGDYILDERNFPTMDDEEGYLGDPNPDWIGGLSTFFQYKGFKLSALVNASFGGDAWNGTFGALTFFGRTPITANQVTVSAQDAATIVTFAGVPIENLTSPNDDGTFTVRGNLEDFGGGTVLLDEAWYESNGGGFDGSAEPFMDDATWAKLRELSLTYTLDNSKLLDRTPLKSMQLSITGRNLWLWTKDDLDYDPESNLTGASNGRGLQYFNHPTTKSYLASIKLNF